MWKIAKLILCQVAIFEKPPNIIATKYSRFTVCLCYECFSIWPTTSLPGVVLNNKLQWDSQVHKMCAKCQRRFLCHMYGCPAAVKELTYMTLVEYCSPVWSPNLKKNISKVERVQWVAARFVTRCPYRRSASDSVIVLIASLGHIAIPETYHPNPTNKPDYLTLGSSSTDKLIMSMPTKYAFIQRTIPLSIMQHRLCCFSWLNL